MASRLGGERTHVSLRLSEERKFLEVIRQGGGGQLHRAFTAVEEDVTAQKHPHT